MAKQKNRKTLSNWLTNRYQLIIRNEENFAEKTTIAFTYSRVIVIGFFLFLLVFFTGVIIQSYVFSAWNDERIVQLRREKIANELSLRVDSLKDEIRLKDDFINSLKIMFNGGEYFTGEKDTILSTDNLAAMGSELDHITPLDSQMREEYKVTNIEEVDGEVESVFSDMYFFRPVIGYNVSNKYNPADNHFGVDIVAKENETIKSISDGTVILSDWTMDTGHIIAIQHANEVVSIYKHNSVLLKKVGNFVKAGDIIAIIGSSGEMSSGPHLHFELWYKGKPLNPENYISF